MPTSDLLLTSIVIITHNNLDYTKSCIDSVRRKTTQGSYELIVIDNDSTDGTQDWLLEQPDIRSIFNRTNVGFPAACNQGINVAQGTDVLLLNNDTIVSENWLDGLRECLYSADDVGAVGPVSNSCSYYQSIPVDYTTIDEIDEFSVRNRELHRHRWERRLKLVGFCMLIKREVIDRIGLLDEEFTPGNFEDDDYSMRIHMDGYKLYLCRDVFVHHFGSVSWKKDVAAFHSLLQTNQRKFSKKWGFDPAYSCYIRFDLIQLMSETSANTPLKVLEVGCGCGTTLMEIRNSFPNAELYGVELDPHSAAVAQQFAAVTNQTIDDGLDHPEGFFDYILLGDVLEHLYDPWTVLEHLRKHLKPDGTVLASIPNIMHVSVMRGLMQGTWSYTEAGLLDKTHIRFFTLHEIDKLFRSSGFSTLGYSGNTIQLSTEDESWIEGASRMVPSTDPIQYRVYQYLVTARL